MSNLSTCKSFPKMSRKYEACLFGQLCTSICCGQARELSNRATHQCPHTHTHTHKSTHTHTKAHLSCLAHSVGVEMVKRKVKMRTRLIHTTTAFPCVFIALLCRACCTPCCQLLYTAFAALLSGSICRKFFPSRFARTHKPQKSKKKERSRERVCVCE